MDNNFTPKYMEELEGLFIELDNHLWRAHADAPCNGVDIESIKISQQGKNSYSIIGITEYDSGPMLILFNVRVNEEKTCGLEIVSEVEIDAATDMEAW
ncbi:MAG: hypothetical protein LUG83_05175 [Lachnospiraceae bacterium]|nr:hypothetical protein [Lachnospiraceae bacterium]